MISPIPINSDAELHRALRSRVEELDVSHNAIDEACNFPAGYTSKLLAPRPIRRFSAMSRWAMIAVLGLDCVLQVSPERERQFTTKLAKHRVKTPLHSVIVHRGVDGRFVWKKRPKVGPGRGNHQLKSKLFMRKIATLGGKASWARMTQAQRSEYSSKLNRVRWAKAKATPAWNGAPGAKK